VSAELTPGARRRAAAALGLAVAVDEDAGGGWSGGRGGQGAFQFSIWSVHHSCDSRHSASILCL